MTAAGMNELEALSDELCMAAAQGMRSLTAWIECELFSADPCVFEEPYLGATLLQGPEEDKILKNVKKNHIFILFHIFRFGIRMNAFIQKLHVSVLYMSST